VRIYVRAAPAAHRSFLVLSEALRSLNGALRSLSVALRSVSGFLGF
jgi:hypothetical protein